MISNECLFEPIHNKSIINKIKDDDEEHKIKERIINTYKASKVFYAKPPSLIIEPSKSNSISHILKEVEDEVDINDMTYYDEYLDGYGSLVNEQKKFLSAIKDGDLETIKNMSLNCDIIRNNILFNDNQVIRECTLSGSLNILKYLKKIFIKDIDLNCERGYCLRWSSRKGFYDIIIWLLYQQKYQKIEINHFGYQCLKWSIDNEYPKIAKILQKYYNQTRKIDINNIFDLPSIYQDIVNGIIDHEENPNNDEFIKTIKKQYKNGCDLTFHDNFAWNVAVDSTNIEILSFLHKTVGINPICNDNYLIKTCLETQNLEMLIYTKSIITWNEWKKSIEPILDKLKLICNNDEILIKELENYHSFPDKSSPIRNNAKFEIPLSPIPWPYENNHIRNKYGILTRSKRKLLVKKGILQDM